MTISTFRSLEQQAIRQSTELKRRDELHGIAIHLMETFGKENQIKTNLPEEPTLETPTNEGKINYYA